jgi:hypothetical protein
MLYSIFNLTKNIMKEALNSNKFIDVHTENTADIPPELAIPLAIGLLATVVSVASATLAYREFVQQNDIRSVFNPKGQNENNMSF